MSTWSGIRNKLENDYLCPALRGHIQYFATSYSKSADHEGRAAIRMDGVEVLRSNYYTYFENVWTKFHHLRSTTLKDHDSAKEAINQAHAFALEQGTFDQKVFYEAFGIFDNQSIEQSLVSENPLVRIFALLDRRLGKRRLLALEESMEQELEWVRAFYVIRMQAEGLMEKDEDGNLSGYSYDYIMKMAQYANWDVEFVFPTTDSLDGAIVEMMDKVEKGQVDMISGLVYNEALADMYAYPEKGYGYAFTTLLASKTNTAINGDNPVSYTHLRAHET